MEIALQILNGILLLWALLQRQKYKMLTIFSLNNLILSFMYLFFKRYASAVVCVVAMLRTIIFGIYAYKKLKPNVWWLVTFEILFVLATILVWQDWFDLLLLFTFIFMCYGSWQDDQLILRITYIVGYTLATIYKAIIGAYISMGVEIMSLIFTIFCLIYYCILNIKTPIIENVKTKIHNKKLNYKIKRQEYEIKKGDIEFMELNRILKDNNFEFKKKFGQNFLTDTNLLNAICDDAGIEGTDEVLEIGVGAGALTNALAERAKKVVGYEIDKTLESVLGQTLIGKQNVTICFKDFLKATAEEVNAEFEGEFKVVANLPYYITTNIIFALVEKPFNVKSLTLMVQKEVADRLSAKVGTKDYGTITAELDAIGYVATKRIVNRNMFTPVPNVDSAIVHIKLDKNKYQIKDLEFLRKVIKVAFSMRRKTLANCLKNGLSLFQNQIDIVFEKLGFDKNIRGEALTTQQFVELSNQINNL